MVEFFLMSLRDDAFSRYNLAVLLAQQKPPVTLITVAVFNRILLAAVGIDFLAVAESAICFRVLSSKIVLLIS